MAFIFVPNADGGFDEGDKQTNDETGVEYIYIDGAWRPLGPKIDEQFPELDERYVNIDGDVMHGTLKFDHGEDTDANILIRPNISNTSTSIYQLNSGALRLRSLPGENLNDGSTTHIAIGKNETDGDPETYIYHLQDPDGPLHAVNLQYLESYVADELEDVELSDYLPLTGGTLTGTTRITGASFFVNNSSGDEVIRLQETGFIRTSDMVRVQRDSSGPAFQARIGSDANAEIKTDGSAFFKGDIAMNGQNITGLADPTANAHAATKKYVDDNFITNNSNNVVTTDWKVLGSGRTFIANNNNELGLYRLKEPSESHHAARKQDVDNHKAKVRTGTSSSPTLSTGELYYNTSTKQLFIGE